LRFEWQAILAENSEESPPKHKHAPWELIAYVAVREQQRAQHLERYFKSGSGHAFWHKRFMN
jgi:hypothetical protein